MNIKFGFAEVFELESLHTDHFIDPRSQNYNFAILLTINN